MTPKFVIAYQTRPVSVQEWEWIVQYSDNEADAYRLYESFLPGPNGQSGPREYQNITIAEVKDYVRE